MKLSVLTAALQELTPREQRDADPDLAIEAWLEFARELKSPFIQLSAAVHPSCGDVPAAVTEKLAEAPAVTTALTGCVVIDGAVTTGE